MNDKVMLSKLIKEDDDLIMCFHPDLFKSLNLKEDQLFLWEPQDDGTIILTPTELKSQL